MNILFICKHNRFRSRVAAALFNKLNRNRQVHARSAGLIIGGRGHRHIEPAARAFGISVIGKQRNITKELLDWVDVLVVVADDVPPGIFKSYVRHGKKMRVWRIRDFTGEGIAPRKKIIAKILVRVKKLVNEVTRG